MSQRRHGWFAVVCGLLAAGGYAATCAKDVTYGGDCGELATAAWCWGVPHPTGYPLYLLLARGLIGLLPFGTVVWRVALLSALAGGVAVGLVAWLVAAWTDDRPAAALAASCLAVTSALWSQTVIAEVYPLHLAACLGLPACLTAYQATGDRRWISALGLVFGLGLTHHLSIVLMLPAVVVWGWRTTAFQDPNSVRAGSDSGLTEVGPGSSPARSAPVPYAVRFRHAVGCALVAAAWSLPPLLLYAYLPLRSAVAPPLGFTEIDSADALLGHLTGRVYGGLLFDQSAEAVRRIATVHLAKLAQDCGWTVFLMPLALACRRRLPGVLEALLLTAAGAFAFGLSYRVGDRLNFLLPMYAAAAATAGLGAAGVRRLLRKPGSSNAAVDTFSGLALLMLPLLPLRGLPAPARASYDRVTMHRNDRARRHTDAVFAETPQGAAVISLSDELTYALWYRQLVDGLRRDVEVKPVTRLDSAGDRARISAEIDARADRPVVLAFDDERLLLTRRWRAGLATVRLLRRGEPDEVRLAAPTGQARPAAGGWALEGATVETATPIEAYWEGRWQILPGLKSQTTGRVTARWRRLPGPAEPVAVALLGALELRNEADASDASPRRQPPLINDSSQRVPAWFVRSLDFGPTARGDEVAAGRVVIEQYPLAVPSRWAKGTAAIRLGLCGGGARPTDLDGWWRATLPVGAIAVYPR